MSFKIKNVQSRASNQSQIVESNGMMVLTKAQEERNCYNYKKLVVPQSMRSIYWKFFGFPAKDDGEIVTKVKIVCILCKTQIAYNRNTSNLRMHLQNKHNNELMELESSTPPKKITLTQPAKEKRALKKLQKSINSSKQQLQIQQQQHIYTTNVDGTVHVDSNLEYITDPNVSLGHLEEDMDIEQPLGVVIKGTASSSGNHQNVTYIVADDNQVQNINVDEKSVSDAIAEFIIMDLQSPEIVEGRGFQKLISTCYSPSKIPSKLKLEQEIIPKIYESFRESVASNLACIDGEIGLTIEEWKSNSDEAFFTFSVYHQNPGEIMLDMKVLSTLHAPLEWNDVQWGNAIDTMLSDWDLKIEKIAAVVVATERQELLDALKVRGLIVVNCLLYSLQICAQTCFDDVDVAEILTKCRAIIGAICMNPSASATLSLQEQMQQLTENGLTMDYPSIWTSTYNMLEQMVLRKGIITTILDTGDGLDQGVLDLTNEQWKVMEDLVFALESLKTTIMTLSEEKIPLISLLKPLVWQLVSTHLKPRSNDSDLAESIKKTLSNNLIERYTDNDVLRFLIISTSLDPRFIRLGYATDEEKQLATEPIKNMLEEIINETMVNEDNTKHSDESVNKKRMSRIQSMFGELSPAKVDKLSAQEKAILELQQYQSESTASLDTCPLSWWSKNSSKYQNLSKLTRRYNCVPACCIPRARILPEIQVTHDIQRANLPSNLSDKLLFLHGNHTI